MPARHSKNHNGRGILTYHERRKMDTWGNKSQRLSADSGQNFDACGLCLQRAVEPLICPAGHMYCKGCVYENLLAQKEHFRRAQEEYQEQLDADEAARRAQEQRPELDRVREFQALADSIHSAPRPAQADAGGKRKRGPVVGYKAVTTATGKEVYVVDEELVLAMQQQKSPQQQQQLHSPQLLSGQDEQPAAPAVRGNDYQTMVEEQQRRRALLPSHWLPSQAPEAAPTRLAPPNPNTQCPMGLHELRLKKLVPVRWSSGTPKQQQSASGVPPVGGEDECSACSDTLSNQKRPTVLRGCGHVVCRTCLEKVVLPAGECADCGVKVNTRPAKGSLAEAKQAPPGARKPALRSKDAIVIAGSKSNFAAGGSQIVKKQIAPAFPG